MPANVQAMCDSCIMRTYPIPSWHDVINWTSASDFMRESECAIVHIREVKFDDENEYEYEYEYE